MSKTKKKIEVVEKETHALVQEAAQDFAPEIKSLDLKESYQAVMDAKLGVAHEKASCKHREIHIALTDIEKHLSAALKNFRFIDMSLEAND